MDPTPIPNYRKHIEAIVNRISETRKLNLSIEEFLLQHDKVITYLMRNGLLHAFDISQTALLLIPAGDPKLLAKLLADHLDLVFTRERDPQTNFYHWIAVIDTLDLPIIIRANEQIDAEGSIVNLY